MELPGGTRERIHLDGKSFFVRASATNGVVDARTRLDFNQRGARVIGRYRGGAIQRGYLVGQLVGETLTYRYAQTESDGHVHGGHAVCDCDMLDDGRLCLREHFVWHTRRGAGTNIFEECDRSGQRAG